MDALRTSPALRFSLPLVAALAVPAYAQAAPKAKPAPAAKPTPAPAKADPTKGAHAVRIAVIADLGAPEADEAAAAALQRSITEHLRASEFEVDDEARTRVTVLVTWQGEDKTTYSAALVMAGDGKDEPSELARVACPTCGSQQLVSAVIAMLDKHADELRHVNDDLQVGPPASVPPPHVDTPPEHAPLRAKRIGPLGIGGAATLGVGVVLAITGGALIGRSGDHIVLPGDSRRRTVDDLRVPGGIVLGTGLGLAVSGAAMLGVDLVRRSRTSRAPRATVAAQIGSAGVGFTVSGRF